MAYHQLLVLNLDFNNLYCIAFYNLHNASKDLLTFNEQITEL